MKMAFLSALGATIALASPAAAQDQGGSLGVGVSGGTLGAGPEVNFRGDSFGVRGSATFLNFGRDVESDGVDYDGDLKLRSVGGSVDFYPGGGNFRVSPGVRLTRNRVELRAAPGATTTVEIGDVVYTGAEIGVLTGEVRPKRLAPTLTVGYGSGRGAGLYFGLDAGVMYQGSPKVRDLSVTGPIATNAAFQTELARERGEIEDEVDNYKWYPILQLSLGFRF
jgi:hypothetical protein